MIEIHETGSGEQVGAMATSAVKGLAMGPSTVSGRGGSLPMNEDESSEDVQRMSVYAYPFFLRGVW